MVGNDTGRFPARDRVDDVEDDSFQDAVGADGVNTRSDAGRRGGECRADEVWVFEEVRRQLGRRPDELQEDGGGDGDDDGEEEEEEEEEEENDDRRKSRLTCNLDSVGSAERRRLRGREGRRFDGLPVGCASSATRTCATASTADRKTDARRRASRLSGIVRRGGGGVRGWCATCGGRMVGRGTVL